ncbi:MAG: hypothetical protein HY901_25245 [Deltaproteobacteria bacterium]|nr:hypothetical protein [Deltaproteobacteria bacterium]
MPVLKTAKAAPATLTAPRQTTPAEAQKIWSNCIVQEDGYNFKSSWKVSESKLPQGKDIQNRVKNLARDNDGLAPTEIYRDPKTGTFAVFSQTEEELDARLWVFSPEGKHLAFADIDDSLEAQWSLAKAEPKMTKPKKTEAKPVADAFDDGEVFARINMLGGGNI